MAAKYEYLMFPSKNNIVVMKRRRTTKIEEAKKKQILMIPIEYELVLIQVEGSFVINKTIQNIL